MSKWIKWDGGECPVATWAHVDLRHRDGTHTSFIVDDETDFWPHHNIGDDIIAYRLHSEPSETPITHKALGRLHAKLDRIERKLDRLIARNDTDIFDISF